MSAARLPESFDRQVSLAVLGDSGCGKTTLSARFCSGKFEVKPLTVGCDFHSRKVTVSDGRHVQVCIWDMAGQERHRALTPVLFRGVHGCMLVYDCTDATTFAHVRFWADELLKMTNSAVPHVLVANKSDAEDERKVVLEQGAALARELGAQSFFETSAKDGGYVEAAFLALVEAALKASDAANAAEGSVATAADAPTRKQTAAAVRLQAETAEGNKRSACSCFFGSSTSE